MLWKRAKYKFIVKTIDNSGKFKRIFICEKLRYSTKKQIAIGEIELVALSF